jgi:hypothetical protein
MGGWELARVWPQARALGPRPPQIIVASSHWMLDVTAHVMALQDDGFLGNLCPKAVLL